MGGKLVIGMCVRAVSEEVEKTSNCELPDVNKAGGMSGHIGSGPSGAKNNRFNKSKRQWMVKHDSQRSVQVR